MLNAIVAVQDTLTNDIVSDTATLLAGAAGGGVITGHVFMIRLSSHIAAMQKEIEALRRDMDRLLGSLWTTGSK